MNPEKINHYGEELYQALKEATAVPPLTERESDITIADAYAISTRILEQRLAAGEKIIGKKIGVTSKPVQDMLGVHQPDFGYLTDSMHVPNGSSVTIAGNMIQPRAEGEIAFLLKHQLKGPDLTEADVLNATEFVVPCFEIVDSRIKEWQIKIEDTVADNASCGTFVLGDARVKPQDIDLENVRMVVSKNGSEISRGQGSAALGSPLTAVAWLANTLSEFDIALEPGEIVLSGSLVPLEDVVPGDTMSLVLEGVGTAEISFC